MAIILQIKRSNSASVIKEIEVNRKLILGQSLYCDVVLDDKLVAGMQCELLRAKSGHIIAKNLDPKKEVLINNSRLKRSQIRSNDALTIGPFILEFDQEKLTPEEASLLDSEFEEYV